MVYRCTGGGNKSYLMVVAVYYVYMLVIYVLHVIYRNGLLKSGCWGWRAPQTPTHSHSHRGLSHANPR